jgi:hypothetical protein
MSAEQRAFWAQCQKLGLKSGAKFPDLVAAQCCLESGFGKHTSGKNNYLGLKSSGSNGSNVATQEFYNGKWVTIKAGFIDFPSIDACIDYLVTRWYKDWKGHKGVNNAPNREASAKMLQSEGYATDPGYADKLIRLMSTYAPALPIAPSPVAPIRLTSAAKHYKEESHQIAAWNWLQERMSAADLKEFASIYRSGPQQKPSNPLKVPYFSQRDNASGQGHRECFSSSCAMVAAFYGKVKGDDEYNKIRARFGDTTNATAQIQALQNLGLKATFRQNVSLAELEAEIRAGRPLACGWLHQGAFTKPSGGGHWSVVVGFAKDATIHMDPFGTCDVVKGGYKSAQGGAYVQYDNRHWLPRWCINGSFDGWAMFVKL